MAVMQIIRFGTEDSSLFDQLATKERELVQLAATMPFARVHLSERSHRITNDALRAAYALMWRRMMRQHMASSDEPLQMLPDCRSCGHGTGNFCNGCTKALCDGCENRAGRCSECLRG